MTLVSKLRGQQEHCIGPRSAGNGSTSGAWKHLWNLQQLCHCGQGMSLERNKVGWPSAQYSTISGRTWCDSERGMELYEHLTLVIMPLEGRENESTSPGSKTCMGRGDKLPIHEAAHVKRTVLSRDSEKAQNITPACTLF